MLPGPAPARGLLQSAVGEQGAEYGADQEVLADLPVDHEIELGRELLVADQEYARVADARLQLGGELVELEDHPDQVDLPPVGRLDAEPQRVGFEVPVVGHELPEDLALIPGAPVRESVEERVEALDLAVGRIVAREARIAIGKVRLHPDIEVVP